LTRPLFFNKGKHIVRPVLFLDIDGVMNSQAHYDRLKARGEPTPPAGWLDPVLVARVNEVCRVTCAEVVITSSWRTCYDKGGLDFVRATLREAGFTGEVIDGTPDLCERAPDGSLLRVAETRGDEIRLWLGENPGRGRWAVVDDLDLGMDAARHVRTDLAHGITGENAEALVWALGGPVPWSVCVVRYSYNSTSTHPEFEERRIVDVGLTPGEALLAGIVLVPPHEPDDGRGEGEVVFLRVLGAGGRQASSFFFVERGHLRIVADVFGDTLAKWASEELAWCESIRGLVELAARNSREAFGHTNTWHVEPVQGLGWVATVRTERGAQVFRAENPSLRRCLAALLQFLAMPWTASAEVERGGA